ncbi:ABC transporter ATP-binding protein [Luteimonas sp. XNQY3]|nr:ABC transporter ATP-binding protein [Luteimonas sp. XNQY3]MCD9005603.1 ABC transporter ATP-binding protein [Luteimonas sp. XNQY3]
MSRTGVRAAGGDGDVPVIETRALEKIYSEGTEAEVVALRGVDLRIMRGEFVAIMGPSGSGKSTLMNLIGALDTPSAGVYLCDGVDVSTLDREALARLRRDKIGFVFQGFNLLPRMSALDNVAMPLGYASVPPAERLERAQAALEAVGLGARTGHRPSELSGGQQQRVAIARALINRPPVLLADEPTGALDTRTGEEILALFKRLRDEGHTVVLITHDPDVAAHADRTYVMRDGELDEEPGLGMNGRASVESGDSGFGSDPNADPNPQSRIPNPGSTP